MDNILSKVLEKIEPTKEENLKKIKISEEIIEKINSFGYNAVLVGSLAKDTNLKEDFDMDIFVKFDINKKKEEMEKEIEEIGKKILNDYEIDYAEHPYIKGKYKEMEIEIVPCYDFGKETFEKFKNIATAVDRTIYHTEFIKNEIKDKEYLKRDIRLLKKFLKGINAYGAESKVCGFSGYLCELLIIYYGGFLNLLKNASQWKYNTFIDIRNYWKGKGKILFNAPLVVIDPVDENRNVAAALSAEKLATFIYNSRKFLKNPSMEFFIGHTTPEISNEQIIAMMKERETKFISVVFEHGKINLNNLYPQLEKTRNALIKQIEKYEFKILNSKIFTNEKNLSLILFELYVFNLPKIEKRLGPRLDDGMKYQDQFLEIYKMVKIEDFRFTAITERKFKNVTELMRYLIKKKLGFGHEFLNLEGKIYEDEEIFSILKNEDLKNFKKFLVEFL